MKQKVLLILTLVSMLMLIGSAVKQESNGIYMKDGKVDHERYELIMQKKIEALQDTLSERYTEEILFEAKWGDGADEYWYYGDSPVYGPGPIAIDNDGSIYVYDGSHGRVMKYTAKGIFEKSIEVNISNRFLSVIDGVITGEIFERFEGGKEINGSYGESYIVGIDVESEQEVFRKKEDSCCGTDNELEMVGDNLVEKTDREIADIENYIRLSDASFSNTNISYRILGKDENNNRYYRINTNVTYYKNSNKSFYDRIDDAKKYTEIQKYNDKGELLGIIQIDESLLLGVGDNMFIDKKGGIYYLNAESKSVLKNFGYKEIPQSIKMHKYVSQK